MNLSQRQRLCIVKLAEPRETFVFAHTRRLPAEVTLLWGPDALPWDSPSRTPSFRALAEKWLRRIVAGEAEEGRITRSYVRAFSRIRPDAVLAEYGTTGAVVVSACRRLGIPLITHFHGYDASRHAVLEQYRESYRRMFDGSARVVAVSRAMEQQLLALGAPRRTLVYNPYGVDCEEFGGARPEQSPPTFVFVGRFVDKKAPNLMVLAFSEVVKARPDARLRMIGDGPLLGVCRGLAKSLGVTNAVSFLGAQSHAVVQQEMRDARCYVQHSVEASDGDCEGTPVAILEAGASGLPVVSTQHAGIPDVVVEGQTGFLVEQHDVAAMAERMIQLIDHPALAGELGQAARRRIGDKFCMQKSITGLWSCIESAIHESRSGRVLGSEVSKASGDTVHVSQLAN